MLTVRIKVDGPLTCGEIAGGGMWYNDDVCFVARY